MNPLDAQRERAIAAALDAQTERAIATTSEGVRENLYSLFVLGSSLAIAILGVVGFAKKMANPSMMVNSISFSVGATIHEAIIRVSKVLSKRRDEKYDEFMLGILPAASLALLAGLIFTESGSFFREINAKLPGVDTASISAALGIIASTVGRRFYAGKFENKPGEMIEWDGNSPLR